MKSLYSNTRKSFLQAVNNLKVQKEVKIIEYLYNSPDKQKLTTEFIKISNPTAKNFILLTGGTVGLDHYISSLVQCKFLESLQNCDFDKVGVIVVHGVNPWGAAWLRPSNINNVDLNHNFFHLPDTIEEVEKDFKDLQNLRKNYKKLEEFINPTKFSMPGLTEIKAFWHVFRMGNEQFFNSLAAKQRHNLIGLGYGGLVFQKEILNFKENVNSLLPPDYTQLVHLDIKTVNENNKSEVFIKTEDDSSCAWMKKEIKCEVVNEKSKVFHASLVSGFRESENCISGSISISVGGAYRRFCALRDENLFHCHNVWVENWSRGELDYWPVDEYIESSYKHNLLKAYFKEESAWKLGALKGSEQILQNTLESLSKPSLK